MLCASMRYISRLCFAHPCADCYTSIPDRLAYWQDRYIYYRKAANKHIGRANNKFIGITSDKFYSTLRGFIIASLSAQLKAE